MSSDTSSGPQWPLHTDRSAPKRDWMAEFLNLQRTPCGGKASGLCQSVADWLDVDVLLIRALYVVTSLCAGFGIVAYAVGWLVTRNSQTGLSPLDHIGQHWRTRSTTEIGIAAVLLIVLTTAAVSRVTGFSWLPIAIIGIIILIGAHAGPPKSHIAPSEVMSAERAADCSGRSSRLPSIITISTVAFAALVGFATMLFGHRHSFVLALSLALAVIGIGLVVSAWFGRGIPLIVCGVLVTVLLVMNMVALHPSDNDSLNYTSAGLLAPQEVYGAQQNIDLSTLPITKDITWAVNLDDSRVAITVPNSQNVIADVSYESSWIDLPDHAPLFDSGKASYEQILDDARPTLTIIIHATNSHVRVIS